MPLPRAFKTDESFLEKIAMGATGTRKVFDDLSRQGHAPIELERGSRSFKIWKAIKIKRVRVPDILCLNCAHRVESRAKTKMEISMSHSESDQERGWDFGLDDSDFIGLVHCQRSGPGPMDWTPALFVQYVGVGSLRQAWKTGLVRLERPKGATEGFEIRATWPAIVATAPGTIAYIDDKYLQYSKSDSHRTVTLRLDRQGTKLVPHVKVDDQIQPSQIIASIVSVSTTWPCVGGADIKTYLRLATSASLSDRYTAVKALAHFHIDESGNALLQRLEDTREHIYVRLDAAAGLMRQNNPLGKEFLATTLQDPYLENRLEAVIALGEVGTSEVGEALAAVLRDTQQHAEIRAGAAWALGEVGALESLHALVESFGNLEVVIRIEAARALAKLSRMHVANVLGTFPTSTPDQRPGIAWALSKAGGFTIDQVFPLLIDQDARQWAAYMIGTQQREAMVSGIEALARRDPEVYFAATVLWKIMVSWVYGLEEY